MPVPYVSVLIKPASGSCNMACTYCFYADVMNNRAVQNYGIMNQKTAHILIDRVFEEAQQGCAFMFQGGEPTLAGLPFFEHFTSQVRVRNTKKIPVHYAIQTNGYAITPEWAAFLGREKFLTGLSLDGIKETNDFFRRDIHGNGVFERVIAAARLFDHHKVEYNILTVVTPQIAAKIHKIFPFYKQSGFLYHQYIPCIPEFEQDGITATVSGKNVRSEPYFLDTKTYASFLKKLFDMWYEGMSRGKYVFVRYFENLAALIAGHRPESCGMSGICSIQFVIEADGGVFPCDFYVTDEWKLGSIQESPFAALRESEKSRSFIERSRELHADCLTCEWYALCRGGCYRDREAHNEKFLNRNRFCAAYKEFFPYAIPRLRSIMAKNGVLQK